MEALISAKDLDLGYGNSVIISSANIAIGKGEFVFFIGKTGSGKSSFLKALYAEVKPISGSLRVGKFAIDKIKKSEIPQLRRSLGIVFQDFQLLGDRNVYDNLKFAMKATGWKSEKKIRNRIEEVLMMVGLGTKKKSYPHQISGGEQQRVAIARALINEPIILLADEPTGNLDPETSEEILQLLWKINRNGTAVLMATHEHDFLKNYDASVIECKRGKLLRQKS